MPAPNAGGGRTGGGRSRAATPAVPAVPPGHGVERVDILAKRQQLVAVLGSEEKTEKYFEALSKFAQFKLSKVELDVKVKNMLGDKNIPLHNEFIKTLLSNALSTTLHPPAPGEDRRLAARKKKRIADGSAQAEGDGHKKDSHDPKLHHKSEAHTQDMHWHAADLQRQQFTICDGADFYDQSWELPSFVTLRRRMRKRCQEQGLTEVSNSAVRFMLCSVEHYLRQVLRRCIRVSRYRRNPEALPEPAGTQVVTPADLLLTVRLHPGLLGQEVTSNLERVGALQFPPQPYGLNMRY